MKMKKKICAMITLISLFIACTGCGAKSYSNDTASSNSSGMSSTMDSYVSDDSSDDYASESWNMAEGDSYDYSIETYEEELTDSAALNSDAANDRKMITTVNMSAETENFTDLVNTIENRVKELNGYMESYETGYQYGYYYDSEENMQYANLTIRIPANNMDGFIKTVEDNANIISRSENTEDVTLSYVDTESRKIALETEYDSLLAILAQAESVDSIIALQTRLSEVRYEIESLESQLRTYDNKINYSTIYLYIDEVNRVTPVITKEKTTWDKISTGLSENIYAIGQWFVNSFITLVVILPYIGLVGVFGLIIFIIIKLALRHDKKKRTEREKAWQQTITRQDSQH